jgi:glyoxylase-like metal-dependent hydrolase (beta-lactamase superfamily II)
MPFDRNTRRIRTLAAIVVLLGFMHFVPLKCMAKDYGKVTSHKVAEGVYLFTTTPYGDVGLSGNSVAILSDDGVLVFDSNGTPETAASVLAEIRKLTGKPVRYLVNSHWHWDHWGGNQTYIAAFPLIQIITHEKTRELMLTVEPRWNEKGLKEDLRSRPRTRRRSASKPPKSGWRPTATFWRRNNRCRRLIPT